MMNNLRRHLLSATLATAIIGWMAWERAITQARSQWDIAATTNGIASATLPEAPPPPSVGQKLVLARAIEQVRFPADYPLMLKTSANALRQDPQRSETWILVARAFIFQGMTKEASVALTHAARLDPNFPGQRQETIPLWTLLGRADVAERVARELSALGVDSRRRAAKGLLQSTYSPAAAFQILGGPNLPPEEIADLLQALRVKGPAMAKLIAAVPEDIFTNPEFRAEAIKLTLDPLLPAEALRIWQAERGLEFSPGGNFLVDNPLLHRLPWDRDFPLGWRAPRIPVWVSVDWISPTQTRRDEGDIRFTFRDSGSEETQEFRWDFYHLLVPADQALEASISLRSDPPNRSVCQFYVAGQDETQWTSPTEFGEAGWQIRQHLISAKPNPRIVVLGLQRNRRGGAGEGRVTLGRLRISKATEAQPAP